MIQNVGKIHRKLVFHCSHYGMSDSTVFQALIACVFSK